MLFSNHPTVTPYPFLVLRHALMLREIGITLCAKSKKESDPNMMLTTALTCLALNIYHEGRGETELGKKIIAQTVMNRAHHNSSNVCREVTRPYQYSWTNRLVIGRQLKLKGLPQEKKVWESCQAIAKKALDGNLDIPKKYQYVTHFHTPRVKPDWSTKMVKLGKIDGHIYYQSKRP